ncbi:hypothetical protein AAEO56_17830 [Flavobacterium sp. DGU11]|uniref:Uncharacterized protein n=1 Tax=Flavobacterium arundinis TaxID=3139143 RepID=A0ABU9I128_9FLAO
MEDFWQAPNRKRYLFNDTYNIDTTILRFSNWFDIEYELNLVRSYCYVFPSGDGTWEEEPISEEDYNNNHEDSDYTSYINYQDLIDRPDYNNLCKEFETIINDSFIHEEQNLFLEFAQKSINQAQTDGQAKSLLKSILQTLDTYSKKQAAILTDGTLNRLQEIIVETYSSNYWDSLKSLVGQYGDIYDQIIEPFKESKPKIEQSDPPKEEIYSQIFSGNAFYLWERLREHFQLDDTSRADFRFMYEAMKHDRYIHKTIRLTDMLNWLNEAYEIGIEKPRFEDFKSDTKRMPIYNILKLQYQSLDK